MGYGWDGEDWGSSLAAEDEKNRRAEEGRMTDFEAMLDYNDMDVEGFHDESNNEQGNIRWRWGKFGRKEYLKRYPSVKLI